MNIFFKKITKVENILVPIKISTKQISVATPPPLPPNNTVWTRLGQKDQIDRTCSGWFGLVGAGNWFCLIFIIYYF